MADKKGPEFLNSKEATEYLGISWHRLRRMTQAGALTRIPGTRWYLRADIERFLLGKGGEQSADTTGTK